MPGGVGEDAPAVAARLEIWLGRAEFQEEGLGLVEVVGCWRRKFSGVFWIASKSRSGQSSVIAVSLNFMDMDTGSSVRGMSEERGSSVAPYFRGRLPPGGDWHRWEVAAVARSPGLASSVSRPGFPPLSLVCSNMAMGEGSWPEWWCYPRQCRRGHVWRPGTISVSWVVCSCASNGKGGHIRVSCRVEACSSVWHDPPHQAGMEVTGRPAG